MLNMKKKSERRGEKKERLRKWEDVWRKDVVNLRKENAVLKKLLARNKERDSMEGGQIKRRKERQEE